MVIRQGSGAPFSPAGMLLFLAGIGCAYNWDRLWDGPARFSRRAVLLGGVALSGGLAALALVRLPPSAFEAVGVLGAVTLAYPWIKRVPLFKNVLVAAVWMAAAAILPFQGGEGPGWVDALIPLGVLWLAACQLCDVKDEDEDRAAAVRNIVSLFGAAWACRGAAVLALLSGLLGLWQGRGGIVAASVLLVLLACFPRLLRRKALGPLIVDATLVVPGLLLWLGWV